MNWSELEKEIRKLAAEQPRGFQARLAERLQVKQPTVAQALSGRIRIPPAWIETLLDTLGMEIVLRPKQQQ